MYQSLYLYNHIHFSYTGLREGKQDTRCRTRCQDNIESIEVVIYIINYRSYLLLVYYPNRDDMLYSLSNAKLLKCKITPWHRNPVFFCPRLVDSQKLPVSDRDMIPNN